MVQPSTNRLLVEAQRGAVNGLAPLGADGKMPDSYLGTAHVNNLIDTKVAAGVTTVKATGKADVGSLVLKGGVPGAMTIQDTLGTNGRRLSIQPENPATSTHSAQLEIVPGTLVSPSEVTSQILLYNKVGANYERFVISCYNGEYQFHSSNLGTGTVKPTYFYAGNVASTAWMEDATFRVYTRIQFWDTPGNVEWASLKAVALNALSTASNLRVAEGTASQIRLGNVAALNRPTILLGTDGTVNINRNAGNIHFSGAGLTLDAGKALKLGTTTTAARPSAVTSGAGVVMYDTTLSKPIYSDGAAWRDAAGTAV